MSTSDQDGYYWRPTDEQRDDSRAMRLARAHGLTSYEGLVERSQSDPEWFWRAAVEDLGLRFATPFSAVYDDTQGPSATTWFTDGTLNLAWNCVGRWADVHPERVAVVGCDEHGVREVVTYEGLWERVRRFAGGLLRTGVKAGDRVALYLPMGVEAVVASHACALVGIVQVPLFSGLAAPALRERMFDADVSAVVTTTSMTRKGTRVALADNALSALGDDLVVPVVVQQVSGDAPPCDERIVPWNRLAAAEPAEVRDLPSEHPYLLAYTSGTTGRPKGILHATAGFLVKVAAEAAYQTDLGVEDRLVWFTDLGWLMGAWSIVGAHANGAGLVMYEGVPTSAPERIWQVCSEAEVSVLGLSPSLVRSMSVETRAEVTSFDLSQLRILASTGEAWDDESYRWFSSAVGRDRLPIINFSGGTEVGACFLSCSPAQAIKLGSVGRPSLGMCVDIVDAHGRSVGVGSGELVCRRPWPGMTRGIWGDPERFLRSYWSQHPGIWTHGDLADRDASGEWFVRGRSDDTLNVAGKRIGPAELESVLASHSGIREAAVVAVADPVKGHTPWAFCVLENPTGGGAHVVQLELIEAIRKEVGMPFVPSRFVYVDRLPKTRSQKIVRRVLRAVADGDDPGDLSGLIDPGSVARIAAQVQAR